MLGGGDVQSILVVRPARTPGKATELHLLGYNVEHLFLSPVTYGDACSTRARVLLQTARLNMLRLESNAAKLPPLGLSARK